VKDSFSMMLRVISLLVVCLLVSQLALAQEATPDLTAEPIQAYYNEDGRFGIALPLEWENQSAGAITHFHNGRSDIYVMQADVTDAAAGIQQALGLINTDYAGEPLHSSDVTLTNGPWTQQLFRPTEAVVISAFGQVYDGRTFVVLHLHEDAASDVVPVVVPDADVQAGMTRALEWVTGGRTVEVIDQQERLTATEATVIEARYDLDDGVTALVRAEQPFDSMTNFIVVEQGSAEALVPIEDTFFQVLLSLFVTPNTTNYLWLGLAASAAVLLVFIAGLVLRQRSLRADLRVLEQLGRDGG
jgi:hypothetical protein